MENYDKIEDAIKRNLDINTGKDAYERMRNVVLDSYRPSEGTGGMLFSGRIFKTNKAALRFAIIAVVIAATFFGLFQWLDGSDTSGVVWADVPKKLNQNFPHIRRIRERWERVSDGKVETEERYKIFYWSPLYGSRTDHFENNRILFQHFVCVATQENVTVFHYNKEYIRYDYNPKPLEWDVEKWVQRFLTSGGKHLGRKTINGRQAEGIEVVAPEDGKKDVLGDASWMRLWVDIETGLPVLQEDEIIRKNVRCHAIEDRYLWDVQFDPNEFLPQIPSDYKKANFKVTSK